MTQVQRTESRQRLRPEDRSVDGLAAVDGVPEDNSYVGEGVIDALDAVS